MRLKLTALTLLVLLLLVCQVLGLPERLGQMMANSEGLSQDISVVRVEDATHLSLQDGRTVSLCGVVVSNTPEAQSSAVKFLEAWFARSEGAILTLISQKQQSQIMGEVTLRLAGTPSSEINLTSDLILQGYGMVDPQQTNCPNFQSFKIAEEIAKRKRLGIWKTTSQS